jgi:hypothetical protein
MANCKRKVEELCQDIDTEALTLLDEIPVQIRKQKMNLFIEAMKEGKSIQELLPQINENKKLHSYLSKTFLHHLETSQPKKQAENNSSSTTNQSIQVDHFEVQSKFSNHHLKNPAQTLQNKIELIEDENWNKLNAEEEKRPQFTCQINEEKENHKIDVGFSDNLKSGNKSRFLMKSNSVRKIEANERSKFCSQEADHSETMRKPFSKMHEIKENQFKSGSSAPSSLHKNAFRPAGILQNLKRPETPSKIRENSTTPLKQNKKTKPIQKETNPPTPSKSSFKAPEFKSPKINLHSTPKPLQNKAILTKTPSKTPQNQIQQSKSPLNYMIPNIHQNTNTNSQTKARRNEANMKISRKKIVSKKAKEKDMSVSDKDKENENNVEVEKVELRACLSLIEEEKSDVEKISEVKGVLKEKEKKKNVRRERKNERKKKEERKVKDSEIKKKTIRKGRKARDCISENADESEEEKEKGNNVLVSDCESVASASVVIVNKNTKNKKKKKKKKKAKAKKTKNNKYPNTRKKPTNNTYK